MYVQLGEHVLCPLMYWSFVHVGRDDPTEDAIDKTGVSEINMPELHGQSAQQFLLFKVSIFATIEGISPRAAGPNGLHSVPE